MGIGDPNPAKPLAPPAAESVYLCARFSCALLDPLHFTSSRISLDPLLYSFGCTEKNGLGVHIQNISFIIIKYNIQIGQIII